MKVKKKGDSIQITAETPQDGKKLTAWFKNLAKQVKQSK